MRRALSPLVLVLACNQPPAQPAAPPVPSASPTPTAAAPPSPLVPPPAATPPAVDPSLSKVVWWCTCYARTGGEPVTTCRSDADDCKGLEKKAVVGGGSGIVPGSLTHLCREVRGDHPGDALGGRDLWRPSKKPGAWLSTGTCLLPGPPDAPTPPASDEAPDVLSAERFGELKLGLPATLVVAKLGEPQKKGSPEEWGADGRYHHTWSWPDKGLDLDLAGENKSGPWTLASITAKAPCDLRTSRGVGVGDPRSSVEAAYGKDRAPDAEPDETSFVAGSIFGGVFFTFDPRTKNVTQIFLGAGAE